MSKPSFVYVTYIRSTPEKVWHALTDPATMKEFDARGMPVQFAAPDEMSAIIRRMLGGGVTPERVREMKHIITEKYYGK